MNIILGVLNAKYVHSSLSIRYLSSYCHEYNIEIFESTINENILDNAMKLIKRKPDIIGFSCYIWNIEQTLKLCSIIKTALPETLLLLGGPEVSYDSREVLKNYKYIDFVISGEGEISFKKLLSTLTDKSEDFSNISGLAYRNKEKILVNENAEIIADLNIIPFPYSKGVPDRIIYYEASRGCPYNCGYCLSSTIKGLRYFDIERVKKELKFFIDNEVKLVKFVDRTFNANRKFALEIWDYLIKNSRNTCFHFEISADLLSYEEILLLKTAPKDLFQFEIGVQTTNESVLKNINRIMDFIKVKNNVEAIMEGGNIHCHLDLIAGLPGEDIESFKRSFDMVMSIYPGVLQLGFLKLLKGAPIFLQREEYHIRHMEFAPYQVLSTSTMTLEDISKLMKLEEIVETYYNSGVFEITIKYSLGLDASPYEYFMGLTEYLEDKGFFYKKYDLKDKFEFLYGYLSKKYEKSLIRDLMLHDFILNTKKAYLPPFLRREIDSIAKEKINRIKLINEKDQNKEGMIYYPSTIKVIKNKNVYKIVKNESIVIFDIHNSKYEYQ